MKKQAVEIIELMKKEEATEHSLFDTFNRHAGPHEKRRHLQDYIVCLNKQIELLGRLNKV